MDLSASRQAWLFFEQLCAKPVGIVEVDPNIERQLLRITDLIGRETEFEKGVVLIYQYSDGSVEKKVVLD